MLEEHYYEAAVSIIDSLLQEHMTTYGYVSKTLLDEYMDCSLKEKFANLETIKSSRVL